ncbi:unnamed protein product [Lactuca virosa]|uniref:Ninja-family protein n=1 Tax=Lactuca virosa TaxID=75947 RepID=A0AAU9LIQ9_9ASTR|nr:unnamed protein product [Lactuca virosa]
MDFLKTIECAGGGGGDGGGGGGGGGVTHSLKEETLGEENVELSLGLSLNGRFGVERRRVVANGYYDNNNRLIRASSVADFSSFPSAMEDPTALTVYPPLTRTCSLPIETGDEWKKRQELQSLRRSEAKRKRGEKLKNGKVVKGLLTSEENYDAKRRNVMKGNDQSWQPPPPSLLPPLPRPSPFPSQVSIGSPASGGSSGVSELESQPFSGINKDDKSTDETLKMMFADMPCVSTKGEGVNGKKIEGFLYRYRKGEQVRIVCVCHGNFLTPAEFVKHGGGGDVEHPLRHIVVNPPSL